MLGLAAVVVFGLHWSLPMFKNAPDLQRTDSGGVFALGVFSGAASACCAPVLAGVVTLSAVTPGTGSSIAIGLAYTFGMVFPLVVITALWDRLGGRNVKILQGRQVTYRLAGRQVRTTTLDLGVAAMFAAMGVLLLIVAAAGASLAPTFQVGIGLTITNWFEQVVAFLDPIPNPVIGLGLVALAATALVLSARRPKGSSPQEHAHMSGDSCHD
jgi:hypothetical protein